MTKYLLFNIGCIECGVSSNVVGVFRTKQEAQELANKLQETHEWREHGQNKFEVFPLPEVGIINEEYLKEVVK